MPFVRRTWNAGFISCAPNALAAQRLGLPKRRTTELCAKTEDEKTGMCAVTSPHSLVAHHSQVSTLPTDQHPTGYIVSNAEDLLSLFDADYGVLVIGEGAKVMGSNDHSQDILLVAEYLRMKQFTYAIPLEGFLLSCSCHSIVCSRSLNA